MLVYYPEGEESTTVSVIACAHPNESAYLHCVSILMETHSSEIPTWYHRKHIEVREASDKDGKHLVWSDGYTVAVMKAMIQAVTVSA